jgi:hypothetical protein
MPDSHKTCSEAHNVQICGRCGLRRQAPDCVQNGGLRADSAVFKMLRDLRAAAKVTLKL